MKQIKNEDFSQTFSNNFQYGASNIVFWVFMFIDPAFRSYPRSPFRRSSALGPQNIARLNTILLFIFEVVITLKLFFVFTLIINYVKSKKIYYSLKAQSTQSSVMRKVDTKRVFIWKWKKVIAPVLAWGSKIVSVYMVYLQGMSHQFEINLSNAFYNKFWNQCDKFFRRSWLFAFGIWKRMETIRICYFVSD